MMAKTGRQAGGHGDCAVCHVKPGEGKYRQLLYGVVHAICHESKTRASMVPDLHNIKTPTHVDFWQTWMALGKAGSLMPAFSIADGKTHWGAGVDTNIELASVRAVLSALNRS